MLNQVTSFYHSSQCNIKPPFVFIFFSLIRCHEIPPPPLLFLPDWKCYAPNAFSPFFNVEARLMIQTWASADRRRKVRKKLEEEEEAFDVKTRREGGREGVQVFPSSPKLRLNVFFNFRVGIFGKLSRREQKPAPLTFQARRRWKTFFPVALIHFASEGKRHSFPMRLSPPLPGECCITALKAPFQCFAFPKNLRAVIPSARVE